MDFYALPPPQLLLIMHQIQNLPCVGLDPHPTRPHPQTLVVALGQTDPPAAGLKYTFQ